MTTCKQCQKLLTTLKALTATTRTFRNVPKSEQEWGPIDDEVLDHAFNLIERLEQHPDPAPTS